MTAETPLSQKVAAMQHEDGSTVYASVYTAPIPLVPEERAPIAVIIMQTSNTLRVITFVPMEDIAETEKQIMAVCDAWKAIGYNGSIGFQMHNGKMHRMFSVSCSV